MGGADVVEVALGDVDVAAGRRRVALGEGAPVAAGRLVGADLRGDDRAFEGHADGGQRGVDEISVGIRQGDQPPPTPVRLGQRGRRVGKYRPAGQRPSQRIPLAFRQRNAKRL